MSEGQNNKIVLITGAAGGLGKALVKTFLSKGFSVIATDLLKPEFAPDRDKPAAGVTRENRLLCYEMDVTADESVHEVKSLLEKENINPCIIINNAGTDSYFLFSETPVSEFRRIFEVNCFGAYRVNQVFIPTLPKPGGRILHIGSESLNLTLPFMPYPLTKKLLEGYAKALRQELKFIGIDVTVIRSGAIDTELLKTVSRLTEKQEPHHDDNPLKKAFRSFASQASGEVGKVISPAKAAEFIFRVSQTPNPRAVYRVNNMLQLRIAAMLPFSLLEIAVHKRLSKTNL